MLYRVREAIRDVVERQHVAPQGNERTRRLTAAPAAQAVGYGGITAVGQVHGMSRVTIQRGMSKRWRDVVGALALPTDRASTQGESRTAVGLAHKLRTPSSALPPAGSAVTRSFASERVGKTLGRGGDRVLPRSDQPVQPGRQNHPPPHSASRSRISIRRSRTRV